jgi:mono/diheme cytochrome c family protein
MSASTNDSPATYRRLHGLLAEYATPGALREAARQVRDAGYKHWDCYSPFPVHGIDNDMAIRPTRLPLLVFGAGLTGCGLGLLLQWWASAYDWPWIVSGKPFFSLPANIPITFEVTILLSAFAAFFGMWAFNRLPQVWHPLFHTERFRKVTNDGFFLCIESEDTKFDARRTRELLEKTGATAVEESHVTEDPAAKRLPKPLVAFMILSAVAAMIPLAYIARARAERSTEPRYHVLSDMDFQPKHKAQSTTAVFADGRASRQPVAGTVARGHLNTDPHLYKGQVDGAWATTLPSTLPLTQEFVNRGREQFSIYCAPCHGEAAAGDGMVQMRAEAINAGWVPPTNLHSDYVVRMPHGQIFHTITNGARTMRGYGAQIDPEDRWAVVLYLRALQRSQAATIRDVPADARDQLR